MLLNNDLKAICSVAAVAKKLRLSRARFYQLLEMGVFPKPVYCTRTKRPFYPLDLQQQCLRIRETGIGHNGQLVIFYNLRKDKPKSRLDNTHKELAEDLKQMGLNVAPNTINNTIKTLYPKGLPVDDDDAVIRELFMHLSDKV